MKNKILWWALISILMLQACEKDELTAFKIKSGIGFYKEGIDAGRDSLSMSFAILKDNIVADTIELPLRIVGKVADVDRVVTVIADPEKTTAIAESYDILPTTVLAGEYTTTLKIRINRIPELKEKEARLWLILQPSNELQVGAKESDNYLLKFNDYLTKPNPWDEVRFGAYSQSKYSLIIRETGYSTFNGLTPDILIYIAAKCRVALYEYEVLYGKEMVDENGVPVRFP